MSLHLQKSLEITQILATRPTLTYLTQFLSNNHCVSGEVSRVYFGRILSNKKIRVEAAHGFKDDECRVGKEFPVESTRPSGRSIIENRIIQETYSEDYYKKYPVLKKDPIEHPWISQVTIPINENYILQLGRYSKFVEGDDYFYLNLQSLLQIYFSRIGKVSIEVGDLHGKPLTSRQKEIAELMRQGMTNEAIADHIGYSASLVKQETMIIFSKLGISGRKDLTQNKVG